MKGETAKLRKLPQNQRVNTPRMTGVTAEPSMLTQIQRVEKSTLKERVSMKKARGERRLKRKENVLVSTQNVIGNTAMVGLRPGGHLSRRVRKRRRQLKEKETQVLNKLRQFTLRDTCKDLMLTRFAEMLDQLTLDLATHKVQKPPTKAAVETTAGKNAVEEA